MDNLLPFVMLNLGIAILANRGLAVPRYTISDLGALPGGNSSFGSSINRRRDMTGYSKIHDGFNHAFFFSKGRMVDLGTLPGGKYSFGYSVSEENNHGTVSITGYADTGNGFDHAFLYADGTMQDLGTLPGGKYSLGTGTNQIGQVAGTSETSAYRNQHAFLYGDGKMLDLGTLPRGTFSQGEGINHSGQVTGTSGSAYGPRAFLYHDGKMTDLGALPGGTFSSGRGVNEYGEVTGEAEVNSGNTHAFLYKKGKMIDLGTLAALTSSVGLAINRTGQVVGVASIPGDFNSFRAFLYSDGEMQNLNGLLEANSGWVLEVASGINDKGEITGMGVFNGEGHAFLLVPAPIHVTDDNKRHNLSREARKSLNANSQLVAK
jgi:probable HAF family extracellular repeat protein